MRTGRLAAAAALVASSGLFLAPSAAIAAPANDSFASAQPLTLPSATTATVLGGSREAGEPSRCGLFSNDATIWFRYDAEIGARVAVRTQELDGLGFTHTMAVYAGDAVDALDLITCDRDNFAFLSATVDFVSEPGRTYWVQVSAPPREDAPFAVSLAPSVSGDISGRVTTMDGAPVQDMCAEVLSTTVFFLSHGIDFTDAGGNYLVSVPPGQYVVHFADCRHLGYSNEYYPDSPALGGAEQVTVLPDETTTNIDAKVHRLGSIAGIVTDHAGSPVDDICVIGWPDGGNPGDVRTWTRPDGRYTLGSLMPGSFRIKFDDCRSTPLLTGEWWNDQPTFQTAQSIEIGDGQDVTGIDAALAPI